MSTDTLPSYILQYFWGDNPEELHFSENKTYILQTILERGDQKAIAWLFSIMDKTDIKNVLPKLKLSKKSTHFWQLYL